MAAVTICSDLWTNTTLSYYSEWRHFHYCIQSLSLSCHATLKCRGVGRVYFPKPVYVGAGTVTCSGQQDVGRSDSVLVQARALWSCEPLREEPVPCDPRRMWRHIEQNWNQKCWLLAQEIQSRKQSHPTWPANTGQKEKRAAASHWILCCLSSSFWQQIPTIQYS